MSALVALVSEAPTLTAQFETLTKQLDDVAVPKEEADFLLVLTPEGLELREVGGATKPLKVDFRSLLKRRRTGKIEPFARAVGVRGRVRPRILDVTAGLAQDAFILASYGCRVHMLERSPVIATLLDDGLRRARTEPDLVSTVGRMSLQMGDANKLLATLTSEANYDAIYLDPMYPERGKSAAKRKEMRFFRALAGDDPDAQVLLELALKTPVRRVVVKRPLKAPPLGAKPSTSLRGTTTRFDLYVR